MSQTFSSTFPNFIAALIGTKNKRQHQQSGKKNLADAELNREYIIGDIESDDEAVKNFLFTLGCYQGQTVTVISVLSENYVISVKDARYSIDADLAKTVVLA